MRARYGAAAERFGCACNKEESAEIEIASV